MGEFRVTAIIDGDTFKVTPGWKFGVQFGDTVRPNHYNTPEKGEAGYAEARERLSKLILGKVVVLSKPITITFGRLLCDVHINGEPLYRFFPEYCLK